MSVSTFLAKPIKIRKTSEKYQACLDISHRE